MRATLPSFLAFSLALALLVGGCASARPERLARDGTSVAVVGLTIREGVTGVNRSVAARDLARRLESGERRRVVGPEATRAALGADPYGALLGRHARTGFLGRDDLGRLVRAPLGTRYALLVRVEQDEVLELAPRRVERRDGEGLAVSDRQRVELATRRRVKLSSLLVDRVDGSVRRSVYEASPVARRDSLRYRGSSFGGSVAALVANRLVNGGTSLDAPPPPSRRATLEALFDEIEASLPRR